MFFFRQVARSSRRRQFLAQGFLCMQAAFRRLWQHVRVEVLTNTVTLDLSCLPPRIWKMARGIPEPEPSKEVETDDANASKRLAESEDPDSSEQIKEVAGRVALVELDVLESNKTNTRGLEASVGSVRRQA